ncbi:hypothetical protein [Sphingomonas sp. Root710]|uniref:hypothetical protein n=1 Tax=Sphingomonas sp. Root710 TaxID=1736594 RepID=UPI000AD4476F|nr:hypothetical protein [Sphingomonas sp. Root710]
MTDDEWKRHAHKAVSAMQAFTAPFVSAISYENTNDVPRLAGTGSFVELFGRRFLLTNEHVFYDPLTGQPRSNPAFGAHGTDDVFRMLYERVSVPYPIDCAIVPVPDNIWLRSHQARTIPLEASNVAHVPVAREIMFFRGYAEEASSFHFENLISGATSYGTQVIEEPPAGPDRRFFFPLHHSPEKAEMIDGPGHLPLPPGFSGSTVWDTRYFACLEQGTAWTPEEARVTGIVCRWCTGDMSIEVLKVEHIRSWLLDAFHQMTVHGHI